MELISVIVPVYKVEQYLDKCIESIVNQTYTNLEIILVDDGSPDKCPQKCDEWAKKDGRIRVIHKENGGSSSAKNVGVANSTAKYISFVDSDDYIETDYIDYLYDLCIKYKSSISICQHRIVSQNRPIIGSETAGEKIFSTEECMKEFLYFGLVDTAPWGKLYSKSLFDEIVYPEGQIFEDLSTTYKLILRCEKIAIGYEKKYNYLVRNNSVSTTVSDEKIVDYARITDEVCDAIVAAFPKLEKASLARKVWARFSVINLILASYSGILEQQKLECRNYIRKHALEILTDFEVKSQEKIGVILISSSIRLYEIIWRKRRGRIV